MSDLVFVSGLVIHAHHGVMEHESKVGQRFMLDVDSRAELAPRDVVAQAIVRTMERTRHPNVYLDL